MEKDYVARIHRLGYLRIHFENYSLFPAYLEQELVYTVGKMTDDMVCVMGTNSCDNSQTVRTHLRNCFERYSGCIPFRSFLGFLTQCKKTSADITKLLCQELRLWKWSVEYDAIIFARKLERLMSKYRNALSLRLHTCLVLRILSKLELYGEGVERNMEKESFGLYTTLVQRMILNVYAPGVVCF